MASLWAKFCDADFPLAVKFPQDIYRWITNSPENLAKLKEPAALLNVSPADFNTWVDNAGMYRSKFYGLADQIIEKIQGGDQAMVEAMRPILDPRHPSPIYASFTEAWIPLAILMFIWRKARKPGLIGSLYILIYAVGRVINENFRLPDAHIADLSQQPLGISRGQFISLWMFIIGLVFLIWSQKRKAEPLGGWATTNTPEKNKKGK